MCARISLEHYFQGYKIRINLANLMWGHRKLVKHIMVCLKYYSAINKNEKNLCALVCKGVSEWMVCVITVHFGKSNNMCWHAQKN